MEDVRAVGDEDLFQSLVADGPDPALDRLARLASRLLGSQISLVSIVGPTSQEFPGEVGLGLRSTPLHQSICRGIVASDAPLTIDDTVAHPVYRDHGATTGLGVGAYAGVPLHSAGRTVGALCAIETSPRAWTPEDLAILDDLARTAEAVLDARLAERRALLAAQYERETSRRLQQTLLPDALPEVEGVRLAAAFIPAANLVGGDWYDVFRLPGGRVAFAIGDVIGHGLRAASAAGHLRMTLRAHLLEDDAPDAVLARTNDLAHERPDLAHSSMTIGVLDPADRRLQWSSAGHPPAILGPPGNVRLDRPAADPLLAVRPVGSTFTVRHEQLADGDGVLLYTDGLVEQRPAALTQHRVDRVRELCQRGWDDLEGLVVRILEDLVPVPSADDVAVLALRLGD